MPRLALTFDDGPSAWTDDVLDVLARHGARASFFVVGSSAESRINLLERAVAEGHELGNHTWSHPTLTDVEDEVVAEELERTSALLQEVTAEPTVLWRAPHFRIDARVEAVAARLGLRHVRGDVAPPDWDARFRAALTATFVLKQARPDAIVVLHDGVPPSESGERGETVRALDIVLRRLGDEWQFVPASEVLAA